jgi:DNA polymerase elongation subunit (family B)
MQPLIFQAIDWVINDVELSNDEESSDESSDNSYSFKKKNKRYLIKIFGRTQKGNSISVNITDYTPYFYVKLPEGFHKNNYNKLLQKIKELIQNKLYNSEDLIKCNIICKKDVWGFTNNKPFHFIMLIFKNHMSMKKAINIFTKPITIQGLVVKKKFKLYENNIEPYLRFIHKQNLETSGWIKIEKYSKSYLYDIKNGFNYDVKWKDVMPYTSNNIAPFIIASFDIECDSFDGSFPNASQTYNKVAFKLFEYFNSLNKNPITNKLYNNTEKKILVYKYFIELFEKNQLNIKNKYNLQNIKNEIEYNHIDDIYSILTGRLHLHDEAIAKLKKNSLMNYFSSNNIDDEMYNTDTKVSNNEIIQKLTNKLNSLYYKNILPKIEGDSIIQIGITTHSYGNKDCSRKIILTLGGCSDIEGIEVIRCNTEDDIIKKWVKLINDIDPDIITGYNIFGFDFDYMYKRAIELGCADQLCNVGKIKEHIKECNFEGNCCKNHWIRKSLSSSALGDNFLKYINMEGRVVIDLMKEIQKGHNLDTYKLDFVAQHFINGKIKDINYNPTDNKHYLNVDNPTGIQNGIYIRIKDKKYAVDEIDYNTNIITIDGKYDDIEGSKWGLAKDDVTPQDIFECMRGTDDDRAKVARYCIQDCALCNYLIIKLEIIANNIGMSNVCSVPFSYIFLRGQGVKIFSLVAKQCKEDNFLIPYQDKKWKCEVCNFNNSSFDDVCQREKGDEICGCPKPENEGYEGAIVLPPTPGIYVDAPISVLDYASLYPSSMISENISHDSIVLDEKYNNLPGYKYVDITYDIFKGKGDDKKKIGEQTCRYAQFPRGQKGLLPRILQKLLKARKTTRKKITWKTITLNSGEQYKGNIIEETDDVIKLKIEDNDETEILKEDIQSKIDTHNEFQKAVLDGLQLAYKITANSLYGQVGAPTSQIFMKELAASTTATGRNLIMSAKKFSEEKYNCEVVYGDSVVGYSPVVIKHNNKIYFEKMEDISSKFGGNKWIPCIEKYKQDKEACELNDVYSWTSKGWTKIHRIIRHQLASHKKIVRILTHTGCIDVTDDHSLLLRDQTKVSPKDLNIGDELLHKDLDFDYPKIDNDIIDSKDVISVDEARIFGMFFGDGSCGYYNCKSGNKYSWAINNSDLELLNYYKNLCEKVYGHNFKINNTLESSNVYKLVSKGDTKSYVTKYRSLFYNNKNKIIPNKIFQSSIEIREAFFQGIYDADGDKQLHKGKITSKRIDQKSMISAMYLYYLGISLGYNVSINTRKDKPNIFRIQYTKSKFRKNPNAIKKMYEINYEGYVYDFTTDNHQFQSGIGNTIVSNTDSVFIKLPKLKDYSHYGHQTEKQNILQYNVTVGEQLSEDFQKLLKPPHCLEWEKMFYPFIIFSKKRYVGNLYEHDVNKFKQKSMGIVLKRRDNANIVKIIYGGIINIILNEKENNIRKSLQFLHESLKKLSNGEYPLEELVVTKTLRAFYKNPQQIAHKVLADRMKKRDPGSAPQSNDRVPYVYIQVKEDKGKKLLQGDKIEDPKYIRENNLTPDYGHYITNQIMKPCLQLYSMILEDIDGYKHKNDKNYWKNLEKSLMEEKKDKKKVDDKIKQLREKEVEELLFSKYLTKIDNKKKGIKTINEFF